jgi:hypothetical protein
MGFYINLIGSQITDLNFFFKYRCDIYESIFENYLSNKNHIILIEYFWIYQRQNL